MSKTSYFLLAILAIILFCFTIFYFSPIVPKPPQRAEKAVVTMQREQTTLSLRPAEQTINGGQIAFVDIFIEEQTITAKTIQLEIGYDPSSITPISVSPGTYFNKPVILLNSINPNNSRISYAITCGDKENTCATKPTQSIARLTFTVNPLSTKKETSLKILPKTLVETSTSTDIKTVDAKVLIQGITMPIATPSAVISQ